MKSLIALTLSFVAASAFAQSSTSYVIGGYLPTNPSQKVYVTVQGRKIVSTLAVKPAAGQLIDTESFIFPGMVDLHNHMEDGFLGLWKSARGQYFNRFEWRANSEYKTAVKNNEAAFDGDNEATCAAFRWAEMKELVGGATTIQGSGAKGSCVSGFGINNVEINGEFGNTAEVRSNLELVNPGNVKRVYLPYIKPKMMAGMTYDQALLKTMDETGVTAWMTTFKTSPRTLANGLKLAFGDSLTASASTDPSAAAAEFNTLIPAITAKAKTLVGADGKPEFKVDPKTGASASLNSYINALKVFLFGDAKNKAYVGNPAPGDDATALDFLGRGGNRTIGSMKRYLTMFEFGLKRGALNALKNHKASAFITHLAEGMRNDSYNKEEFRIARDMGLVVPGMVLIHSVGMHVDPGVNPASASAAQSDFKYAAQNGVSLVWSPFSNLLLYGETLDIAEARANGLNIAMGIDWSPTGSKNMLDELKIARRYIDQRLNRTDITARERQMLQQFNDQALSEMATVNAYKAMGISNLVGKIEPGYQADLTLIAKTAMNRNPKADRTAYSAMVYADQSDVSLVVVKGQPLYGDTSSIKTAATIFGDNRPLENLPGANGASNGANCKMDKAMRFPFSSALDSSISSGRNFLSVSGIESALNQVLRNNRSVDEAHRATLDLLYTCQETQNTQYGSRFSTFVEKEVPADLMQRQQLRQSQNLGVTFDLMNLGNDDQ